MAVKQTVKPLKKSIIDYVKRHRLEKKFQKSIELFEQDINHPSLNIEILEPKHLRVYSFRIDRKYRSIFVFTGSEVEIIAITNHYR